VEDLVEAGLLDVEDLTSEREDGLEVPVAGLLGRAAGGVALDEEDLALGGVLGGAVGELAGEAGPAEGALALDELARLPRRGAGLRAERHLLDDLLRVVRVVVEPLGQFLADEALDGALDFGVAELRL